MIDTPIEWLYVGLSAVFSVAVVVPFIRARRAQQRQPRPEHPISRRYIDALKDVGADPELIAWAEERAADRQEAIR